METRSMQTGNEIYMPVTQSQIKQPLFALGRLVATPGALELLTRSEQTPLEFLARHSRGDWGECCPDDATEKTFQSKPGSETSASIAHGMAKSFGSSPKPTEA
jgi:hypothetical protein